eukprot:scaffold934_cov69-Phaeocystis_antarctica.AAC.6
MSSRWPESASTIYACWERRLDAWRERNASKLARGKTSGAWFQGLKHCFVPSERQPAQATPRSGAPGDAGRSHTSGRSVPRYSSAGRWPRLRQSLAKCQT